MGTMPESAFSNRADLLKWARAELRVREANAVAADALASPAMLAYLADMERREDHESMRRVWGETYRPAYGRRSLLVRRDDRADWRTSATVVEAEYARRCAEAGPVVTTHADGRVTVAVTSTGTLKTGSGRGGRRAGAGRPRTASAQRQRELAAERKRRQRERDKAEAELEARQRASMARLTALNPAAIE